jgi:hypothetical protein
VNSNIAWLISPKLIWIHTNEILTFRTAQHHLDVDSPLNTIEVYVSTDFDGLNVKASWIPLDVIVPKTSHAMVSVCGSGGVDLSSYTELILHSSTLVRKKPCVGWGFPSR